MAELCGDEVLHQPSGGHINIGGAFVQAHDARPLQQHPRQAQHLLLPCTDEQHDLI